MTDVIEAIEQEIERAIIRSFGYSIIEFEPVLFHKFLIVAGAHSAITPEKFRSHLMKMHSKGYVSPLEFQGKRSWRKLIVEDQIINDSDSEIEKSIAPMETKRKIAPPRDRVVTESRILADDMLKIIESKLRQEGLKEKELDKLASEHVQNMRRALSRSEELFFQYVQDVLPTLFDSFAALLKSKGTDILLPALRYLECSL
ncbi:MAG: hypothetical protein BAJATHORv1_10278 [Candidatus Thorarchaeota archaeon]|nr:MAG: hypothetical protein BAJATHORv1_10278 [Candidatus Thorarchaeota archaeon]